jgi:hypothetical protein
MRISGWEDWSPDEIANRLNGDDIKTDDLPGTHGALIVLCRRVAELTEEVRRLKGAEERLRATDIFGGGP